METSPIPAPAHAEPIEEAIELLWAAALPIINAVFMCAIGAFLARRVGSTSLIASRSTTCPRPGWLVYGLRKLAGCAQTACAFCRAY